jgi:hypothetical protein
MTTPRPGIKLGAAAPLPVLLLALACGDRQTVASKSAASYDEAQRKGTPVGDGGAHGHAPPSEAASPGPATQGGHSSSPAAPAGNVHAAHGRPAEDGHAMHGDTASGVPVKRPGPAGHVHGSRSGMRGSGTPARTAEDHSSHATHGGQPGPDGRTTPAAHAGHRVKPEEQAHTDHSATGHAQESTVDHASMGHGPGMAMAPPKPEAPSSTAAPGDPVVTLRQDGVDAPAATAVAETDRFGALAAEMATSGHGMQHGTYVQTDAGREGAGSGSDPHRMHRAPATPRPAPSPSPRPTPSPSPRKEHHR